MLMPMDVVAIPWVNFQTSTYFMLTGLPAATVLLATGHRVPDGLNLMRWIWMHARWLLLSSYTAGIAVFIYVNREAMTDPDAWNFLDAVFVVIIDLAFVGYLLTSELVRDVFKDFPTSTKNNRE